MGDSGCANCAWRARYDQKPRSLLGRLWRWHVGFCPGWRSYMRSLPDDERKAMIERYHLPAGKFA